MVKRIDCQSVMRAGVALFLTMTAGCGKDFSPPGEVDNLQIERAKAFFETNCFPEGKTRTLIRSPMPIIDELDVEPVWEVGLYCENETERYVEVPTLSSIKSTDGADDSDVHFVSHRLVVREIKETGELYMYTSLWIPDDRESEIEMGGLTMFDKGEFSGVIYFFHPDGSFYWGAGFEKGRAVRSETIIDPEYMDFLADKQLTTRGATCITYIVDQYFMICEDAASGLNCSDWRLGSYAKTTCIFSSIDGGGGYPPPPTPPPPSGGGTPPPNANPSAHYKASVTALEAALKRAVAIKITNVEGKFKIRISSDLAEGQLAQFSASLDGIFDTDAELILYLSDNLTQEQLKLILGHEIAGHLVLFDQMRRAGSPQGLSAINSELLSDMTKYGINEGQHNYIGNYSDQFEAFMRAAFPGESEDFYKLGKWGGGVYNSAAFDALTRTQRNKILKYLTGAGVYIP